MKRNSLDTISHLLTCCFLVAASLYLIVFVLLAIKRMTYPYELDWLEGAFVDHAKRVFEGKQLYVQPSLEFTPYFYTPLYFYISALVAKVVGLGFLPLRLVSFLASLGCFALIFAFVRRETNSVLYGVVSAGVYAATYRIGGTWFDLAKLDSLFMLFVLAGIYLLRFRQDLKGMIFAAFIMFLAFFTKQSALLIALALSGYCFFVYRGWARLAFPVTFLSLLAISTVILNGLTEGWYYYYIFDLPAQHRLVTSMFLGFWSQDILPSLFIAVFAGVAFLLYKFRTTWATSNSPQSLGATQPGSPTEAIKGRLRGEGLTGLLFLAVMFAAMIGSSWTARLHSGSWLNSLMPAHAAIAIFFGLGVHALTSRLDSRILTQSVAAIVVLLVCLAQFPLLSYNPFDYVPTKADAEAGDAFISTLSQIDGDIFISYPGFLPTLAGKKYYSDGGALGDIFRGKDAELKKELRTEIKEAIRQRRFQAIITNSQWFGFFVNSPGFIREVAKYYVDKGPIFEEEDVFFHVTGGRVRPDRLFVLNN